MYILTWFVVGAFVGWMSTRTRRKKRLKTLLSVLAGIGGSITGGIMITPVADAIGMSTTAAFWGELLICTGSAIMTLSMIGYLRQMGSGHDLGLHLPHRNSTTSGSLSDSLTAGH